MEFQRDKDFAWVITFTSFLVFLLSAIACSYFETQPDMPPLPVLLARANLGRAFVANLVRLVRYAAILGIGLGIFGIITWPSGTDR